MNNPEVKQTLPKHDPQAQTDLLASGINSLHERLTQVASLGASHEQVGNLTVDKPSWERRYQLSLAGASVAIESVVAPTENELSDKEIVRRMEHDGVVKEAPKFSDLIKDDSRTNRFNYTNRSRGSNGYKSMSEIAGLRELHGLLTNFLGLPEPRGWDKVRHARDTNRARSMLENLTFIGEKELQEASAGMAEYWKAYLDADPNRQICVLASTNQLGRYEGKNKSDEYIRDRVLQTFSYPDLAQYSGRIVGSLDDLNAEPKDAKIVLIDDWVVSGSQLTDVYTMLYQDERFREYADAGAVEANLVVADRNRLSLGLPVNTSGAGNWLKVKSYFLAHHSDYVSKEGQSNLASSHSTPDGDFRNTLQGIVKRYGRYGLVLPKLARVKKNYPAKQKVVSIGRDKLVRQGL